MDKIANYIHSFLHSPGLGNVLWVFVDNPQHGIDIAYKAAKLDLGSQPVEIPYDTLPILVGINADTGKSAFIFSQPNHVDSIQVTMQGTAEVMYERAMTPPEKQYWSAFVGDVDLVGHIYQAKQDQKTFVPRKVDELLVDAAAPPWEWLVSVINPTTKIHLTDRTPAINAAPTMKEILGT